MVDVQRQVAHWRQGAEEDWNFGLAALDDMGKPRHGLFFLHLSLEKVLKGHFCKTAEDIAPRLHNLVRLAELSGLPVTEEQLDLLADMSSFNLEGRYPDLLAPAPTMAEAREYARRAEEVFKWLMRKL